MVADRIIVIFERVVFWVYWILLFSQYIYRDRWLALVEYGGQTLMALRTPQAYELRLEVLASEKGIVFLLFSSDSFLLCETPGLFDEEDQQCCGGLRNSQTICLSNQVITSKSQRNFFNCVGRLSKSSGSNAMRRRLIPGSRPEMIARRFTVKVKLWSTVVKEITSKYKVTTAFRQ